MRVQLTIPDDEKDKPPKYCGEHYGYDGRTGDIIASAGKDGAYVQFDGEKGYVGCPVKWLHGVN